MSIKIEVKSKRSQYYELNVISYYKQWYKDGNATLENIQSSFEKDMETIPRKATQRVIDCFKPFLLNDENGKRLEIWKLNGYGEKDRIVMILTDDGKQNNPFSF